MRISRTIQFSTIACVLVIALFVFSGSNANTASRGVSPRNVILIIPDGCSIATWAAVRTVTVGIDGKLNIDRMPVQSRARTYSANSFITDSAASGTAYATGVKTNNGIIGKDATTIRGNAESGNAVESVLEAAEAAGYATGLISTASIQHATPAAFYAHQSDRDWYALIANELVDHDIEVVMGGGREHMIPRGTIDEEGARSARRDERNLIEEMQAKGYTYIADQAGFDAIEPSTTDKLLGLFNPGHMQYEYDRADDTLGEPPLWDMAQKALDILSRNDTGFFLMIEAAKIDHAAHDNDATRWLWDGIACDKTIGVAQAFAESHPNTLVIVVPDHGTGGPHVIGVRSTADSTRRVFEPAGYPAFKLDDNGFPLRRQETEIAIGWASSRYYLDGTRFNPRIQPHGNHTAEDVGLHAMGPGSEKLTGLNDNIDINRVIREHLGL